MGRHNWSLTSAGHEEVVLALRLSLLLSTDTLQVVNREFIDSSLPLLNAETPAGAPQRLQSTKSGIDLVGGWPSPKFSRSIDPVFICVDSNCLLYMVDKEERMILFVIIVRASRVALTSISCHHQFKSGAFWI